MLIKDLQKILDKLNPHMEVGLAVDFDDVLLLEAFEIDVADCWVNSGGDPVVGTPTESGDCDPFRALVIRPLR